MTKIAVVGATGLVGTTMIQILEERHFPVDELIPVASEKSVGQLVPFRGKTYPVVSPAQAVAQKPHLALFSAGAGVSREWAPRFAQAGCWVVDNSSCWRMDPQIRLVVPEINAHVLRQPGPDTVKNRIIANPNCSTIQMVMALAPLHRAYGLKRIVVSTYQSVTGTGQKAVRQLQGERNGSLTGGEGPYPYPIDLNLIPQIDDFLADGYTKEERKMMDETRKILENNTIGVSATTVRVPVTGGHSESVNATFDKPFTLEEVRKLLAAFPGVTIQDTPALLYPMPKYACGRDDVFVGRLRLDPSCANTLNLWIVSDNLRKGAATNAVQIAEALQALESRDGE